MLRSLVTSSGWNRGGIFTPANLALAALPALAERAVKITATPRSALPADFKTNPAVRASEICNWTDAAAWWY